MTRKKVRLAYISDDSARKVTYKKRKKGLLKKLNEISILCDVKACAVISSNFEPEPQAWPSQMEAEAVIAKFNNLPEMDQSVRMVNQETFIKTRIQKVEDQLKTKQAENKDKMMKRIMFDVMNGFGVPPNMSTLDMQNLQSFVGRYMEGVSLRMESLHKEEEEEQKNAVTVEANVNMVGEHAMQAAGTSTIQGEENVSENVNKDLETIQTEKWIEEMISQPPPEGGPSSGSFGFAEDEDIILPPFDDQNGYWSGPFLP